MEWFDDQLREPMSPSAGGNMRLVLDIDSAAQPVSGWLEDSDQRRVAFTGLLDLLAVLERALDGLPPGSPEDSRAG